MFAHLYKYAITYLKMFQAGRMPQNVDYCANAVLHSGTLRGFSYHCCSVRKDQLERKQKKCLQTVTHFSYTSIKLVMQIFSRVFPTYSSQLICFGDSCCVIRLMTAWTHLDVLYMYSFEISMMAI